MCAEVSKENYFVINGCKKKLCRKGIDIQKCPHYAVNGVVGAFYVANKYLL